MLVKVTSLILIILLLLGAQIESVEGFMTTRQTGSLSTRILNNRERSSRWSNLPSNDYDMEELGVNYIADEEEIPRTMGKALRRFFLGRDLGPISALSIITWLATSRLALTIGFGANDIIAFSCAVVFWWFQEHFLHRRLLHSSFNWLGKEIHQGHHEKPYFHISIDPIELMVGWLAVAHILFRILLPLDMALSATVGYSLAGLGYEWSHYIAHTRVRPPTRFLRTMRDNHMKHHLVDSQYWLAFSLPMIDDIFRTNPDVRDVKKMKLKRKMNKRKQKCIVS
mmetsp:Transcript_27975/g.41317  ORF Transcript_27975/g.41317 Transcript_27975/m.41317 type:complete len:282 (-) Transcript_27975:458-1303(-)